MRNKNHGYFLTGLLCGICFMVGLGAGVTKAPILGTLGDLNGIASKVFWRLDGKNPPSSAITWDLSNITLKVNRIEAVSGQIHTLRFYPALSTSEESALISPDNDGTLYFLENTSGLSFGHIEDNDTFHWGMISDDISSATEGLKGIIEGATGTLADWVNRG